MSDNWLESVKAGDAVIIRGRYGVGRDIAKVGRLTKTRIMVTLRSGDASNPVEVAFNRQRGYEVGADHWASRQLEQGTPEALTAVRNENRKARIARELGHRNWENVPLEKLEQIMAILTPKVSGSPTE